MDDDAPTSTGPAATRTERSPLGTFYWRIWTADGLSNLADGILKVALPLVALDYTRSPVLIAGLTFAFTLPWLIFALPSGALVDRLDRRRAMLGATGVQAAALAALVVIVAAGLGSIWALGVVAFSVGTAETVYGTSVQSIIPRLVSRDVLSRANGRLFAVELTANEFLGPPLAGLLVATSAAVALATPLGLWAIALAAMVLVRGHFRAEQASRSTLRADIAQGARFVWRNRLLRSLAAMTGIYNFATSATFAVFVLYAAGSASAMGLSKLAYGVILATAAAGSVAGSFFTEQITRVLGRARSLMLTVPGGALLVGIPAITTNPFLIGTGFFVGGAANIVWNVIAVSLRQQITPDRLLGRMTSVYRLVAWGSMPLGAVAGGLLAQLTGLRAVFAVMAALMLTLIIGMRTITNDRMARAERDAETASFE